MDQKERLLKWYFTTIIFLAFFVYMDVGLTPDGLALLEFKHDLTTTSPLLENWNALDASPCLWGGILCTTSGDVQNITLSSQLPKLEGKISPSLGKLKSLQVLMLEHNLVSGSIPSELGSLTSLRTLSLHDNNLSDKIPLELGNCNSLVELWLDNNKLRGTIPETLGNLKNLSSVFLGTNPAMNNHGINQYQFFVSNSPEAPFDNHNVLTSSLKPMNFSKFRNLKEFDVSNNDLIDNITTVLEEFSKNPNIEWISMQENGFKGTLPPLIGNATTLRWLSLWSQKGGEFGGEIPKEIGKLVNLVCLDLHRNNFIGEIPKEIGQLVNLKLLSLEENKFKGKIPVELGKLKGLNYLYLWKNNLVGEIPLELGNMASLKDLDLSRNNLNGTIPSSLGNLINLNWLNLDINNLHGTIPSSLGNLINLNWLMLSNNNLQGTIPSSLGNLVDLKNISIHNNSISGSIPTTFASLTKLDTFSFSQNFITGPFPTYATSKMTSLRVLNCFFNKMWGPIPEDFGKHMPNLTRISLSSNLFNGTLPNELCHGGKLRALSVRNNQFEGAIPFSLAKCTSLIDVDFSINQFTSFPNNFGRDSSLEFLDISHNQFMGNLPKGLGANSSLSKVDLSENKFTGEISLLEFPQLAHNLSSLNLSKNNFTGEIPSTMGMCNLLFEVDLSHNSLTGVVPLALANLSRLQILQLQENNLVKLDPSMYSNWATTLRILNLAKNPWNVPIASEIGSLEVLQNLNLSHGGLVGSIPSQLSKLTRLEVLDLSHNNLTGEVPSDLGVLSKSLTSINISFNHLTGSLPPTWVELLYAYPNSFQGNPGLCLEYNSSTKLCMNNTPSMGHKAKLSIGIIVVIALGGALAIMIIIAFLSLRLLSIRSSRKHTPRLDDIIVKNLTRTPLPFTFEEIMIATENLNDAYIIGQGHHGIVYKVVSISSNTSIAVKKIESLDMTATLVHGSFWREVETIGNAKHRNLVRLLGFMKWGQVGLLLYDYISKGNLHSALHNKELKESDVKFLNWKTRLHIAVGVADGLAYLHHDCNPPIIHRDIKSANILLDNDLEAHISDFGLAKALLANSTQPQSHQQWASTSNVFGTYGYIAPEVGSGTPISPKLDVYSFGILLLELLTGRQPIEANYGETLHIVEWVKASALENKSMLSNSIVDPLLLSNADLVIKHEMLTMQRIALLCIKENPGDRPSMRDVAQLLKNELSHKIGM